jgi:hypothetical protein
MVVTAPFVDREPLAGAASLTRGLLILARRPGGGTLRIQGIRDGRTVRGRVDVRGGRLEAVAVTPSSAPRLGQLLDDGPGALCRGLRRQARHRLRELFALRPEEVSFRRDRTEDPMPEPPTVAEALLGAVRDDLGEPDDGTLRRRLGAGVVELTSLGRELLDAAPLWPGEAALRRLLAAPRSIAEVLAAVDGDPRALRLLYGLTRIGGCAAPSPEGTSYVALLSKTRQLRRSDDARALLGMEPGESPRSAFRRLATQLHPDRFAADAAPGVQAASREVMAALLDARRRVERA